MAVRDDRSDVRQTTTGFRGPLMVQSLTSAKSKFLSLSYPLSTCCCWLYHGIEGWGANGNGRWRYSFYQLHLLRCSAYIFGLVDLHLKADSTTIRPNLKTRRTAGNDCEF